MQVTRRQFFKICGAGLGASSLAYLGFSPEPALAEVRASSWRAPPKRRSTCPYCSVSCGLMMYTLGDKAKNANSSIIHIEGDPDHPVNRGTLCPKGAGLLDMITAPEPPQVPAVRAPRQRPSGSASPGTTRSTASPSLMKADRDANFVGRTTRARPSTAGSRTGFLRASASTNESGYLTHKVVALAGDGRTRQPSTHLTRTDGGQSGPDVSVAER